VSDSSGKYGYPRCVVAPSAIVPSSRHQSHRRGTAHEGSSATGLRRAIPPESVGNGRLRERSGICELNDSWDRVARSTVRRPFRRHQTVKDILEAMGIPHTEVDLILVNGNAENFAHRPTSGDRIAVYPVFEALDIGSTARLRPVPLRDPRFVIDVNLVGWRGCFACSGSTCGGPVTRMTRPWSMSAWASSGFC